MKQLLTGNEAVARGVYEYGTHFASAYPGTPSSEILKNIARYDEVVSEWAPNEKTAMEAAIGASFAGGRSVAAMKHVGVNVAADPLFTFSYAGVSGGMILVSADEPGMHSSQNEQDNRNYARFAKIPMFEPSNSQEAKDFIKDAYELSERYDTPVLLRLTTRICHSKGIVITGERQDIPIREYTKDAMKRVCVPLVARSARLRVENRMQALQDLTNACKWNYPLYNRGKIGIITSGGVYEYAREVFGNDASYLKLGFTNPLPTTLIEEFAGKVEILYIIEENDPYIEDHVRKLGIACKGKELFPFTGEMTPDVIRKSVFGKSRESKKINPEKVIKRPPTFCAGCPHRRIFLELGKRKDLVIAGDIGCYSLSFTEPYNAMDWLICMGAGFSTGHGAQKVLNQKPNNTKKVVGIMGDSTFFHTGINSLMEVAYNRSSTVNIILDNRTTGMTGGQDNPGSGFDIKGNAVSAIDIEAMVKACGIKNVRTVNPHVKEEIIGSLNWALALDEPSVIITRWPCVLKRTHSDEDKATFDTIHTQKCSVVTDSCRACKRCLKTGCPAIGFDKKANTAYIDAVQCVGCEVCADACPFDAIIVQENTK